MIDNNLPIVEGGGCELIQFSEFEKDYDDAYLLEKGFGLVAIKSMDGEVFVDTEEDAKNLIRALQKAIERGWWKE